MNWVVKESSKIIATSDATKADIVSLLAIPEEKVVTIYAGVDIVSVPKQTQDEVLQKYKIKQPFVLAVGKVEPRKNIGRLIDAFKMIEIPGWSLVIVGPQGWDEKSIEKKSETIQFTGHVSETELHAFYDLCSFFVFPSIWEGFGHPIIEAMKHKKAVIASDTPSLVEVGGGHTQLCDPLSPESIKNAMVSLMTNEQDRATIANDGYEYSQKFTWKRYITELLDIITK